MSSNMELDDALLGQLSALGDLPPRDPDRAARGRAAFLVEAEAAAAGIPKAVSAEPTGRLNSWMHAIRTRFPTQAKERSPMFSAMSTALLIVSLLLGGGGATVAAAQQSLPDQPLYPVKTWSEQLRTQLTNREQSRLELTLQLMDRRAGETLAILQAGEVPPDALQTRLQAQVEQALQLAAGRAGNETAAALNQVRQRLQAQEQAFLALGQSGDPQVNAALTRTRSMLHESVQLCEEGLRDPAQLRDHLRDLDRDRQHDGSSTAPGGEPEGPAAGGLAATGTPGQNRSGPGPNVHEDETESPHNPWTTGTPTPGSSYGPGPGDCTGDCDGDTHNGENNPWTDEVPTPGSGYGPGPAHTETVHDGDGAGSGPGPQQEQPQPTPSGSHDGDGEMEGSGNPGGEEADGEGHGGDSSGGQNGGSGGHP